MNAIEQVLWNYVQSDEARAEIKRVVDTALAAAQARAAEMGWERDALRDALIKRIMCNLIAAGRVMGLPGAEKHARTVAEQEVRALLSPSPSARPAAEEPESQGAARHERHDLRPGLDDCVRDAKCATCQHATAVQNVTGVPRWACSVYQLMKRFVPECSAWVPLPAPSPTDGACKTCARCLGSGRVVEAGRQIVTCPDCKGVGSPSARPAAEEPERQETPAQNACEHHWRDGRRLPGEVEEYDDEWCDRCGARFSEVEGEIEEFEDGDHFQHGPKCEGGCDYSCGGVFICGKCGGKWDGVPAEHRCPAPSPTDGACRECGCLPTDPHPCCRCPACARPGEKNG